MRNTRISIATLGCAGLALLVISALAPAPAAAEPQAARSRSSASPSSSPSSSGSSARSGSSSTSRGSRSTGRAAVTRSGSRGGSPSGSRRAVGYSEGYRGGHHGRPGGYNGYRGRYPGSYYPGYYGPSYGISLGLGWWGGYLPYYYGYGPYRYGYHPYYYPPYYGRSYAARVYADPVGAFDLNIKPKKTQVWVDGRYIGTVGKFDGFPDYLWLSEGNHQLVFYLDGYLTVERRVETLAGVVADLRIDMKKGPSTPAEEVASEPPRAARRAPVTAERAPAERRPPIRPKSEEPAAEAVGSLDTREAPGRLVLSVRPDDASVYLDGRFLGTGRDLARLHAGLLVAEGEHRLEVVRPGFDARAIDFSIGAGEEERIEVGLEGS